VKLEDDNNLEPKNGDIVGELYSTTYASVVYSPPAF
jgi:hypothetical protein